MRDAGGSNHRLRLSSCASLHRSLRAQLGIVYGPPGRAFRSASWSLCLVCPGSHLVAHACSLFSSLEQDRLQKYAPALTDTWPPQSSKASGAVLSAIRILPWWPAASMPPPSTTPAMTRWATTARTCQCVGLWVPGLCDWQAAVMQQTCAVHTEHAGPVGRVCPRTL